MSELNKEELKPRLQEIQGYFFKKAKDIGHMNRRNSEIMMDRWMTIKEVEKVVDDLRSSEAKLKKRIEELERDNHFMTGRLHRQDSTVIMQKDEIKSFESEIERLKGGGWKSMADNPPAPTKHIVNTYSKEHGILSGTSSEVRYWEGVTHWKPIEPPTEAKES